MKEREISERQEREAERALFRAVLELESVDEARAFFRDLCTPAELQAMADRWAVVGPLERREKPVAGMDDLLAAVLGNGRTQLTVVPVEQLGPRLVANRLEEIGGRDDVGEHECPLRRPATAGGRGIGPQQGLDLA